MKPDSIICGDNVETLKTFPNGSIDLVVTSPPYDNLRTYASNTPIDQLWDFEALSAELWRTIKPGGVVVWVDPFAGSFTTCKMAREMGRRWIGIEINADYCEIGRKRMAQQLLFS